MTALAASRMTDSQLVALGALVDSISAATDLNQLIAGDLEFHRQIALGSGNPVLASLMESLSAPTLRARVWRGLTQEGAVSRTHEQHQALHQALLAREPELARSWATVHIAGVEDWLRRVL